MPAMSTAVPVLEFVAATVDLPGGRRILGPVSLSVQAGEHWALLGPNGSGKTTLLSLAGAERHPSSGSVDVLGCRLGHVDLRELRARIGTVGHRVADRLPPAATGLEIVLTGARGLLAPWWGSFSAAETAQARALLESLGCAHLADQPLARCSQGERQRILLGRSLLGGHPVLLLDEPAVGVDLPGREALVGALDRLAALPEAPTTVHVAHTLEELPASTTHAMLLRDGEIVASGRAGEVLAPEPLSAAFGIDFSVECRDDGRYFAWARPRW